MTTPWTEESLFGQAAKMRCREASREAFFRLGRAKSEDEKVKATIDFVVAHQRMWLELYDRDRRASDIIDLIDSETPLDREARRLIVERLQELLFQEPKGRRRGEDPVTGLYRSAHADMMKEYLRAWAGLSAERAEEEVANHFGEKLETLRTRKRRAKRAMRLWLKSLAPSPVAAGCEKLLAVLLRRNRPA
jgi:hypothetical protein